MLKFFKKIFHPKSTLYPLLLGLMSFLAIVVSLLTLKEMKTQRDLSMQPIVRIENFDNKLMHVDSSCSDMIYNDEINLYKSNELSMINQGFTTAKVGEWFALEMINVGKGAAVDLQVDWELNYNYFNDVFTELQLDKKTFTFSNKNESVLITYNKCNDATNAYSSQSNSTIQISHLLPAENQNTTIKIPIPNQILKLQIALIKAKWLLEGQTFDNIASSKVPHNFTVKYASVNGSKFEQSYKMSLAISAPSQRIINGKLFASYKNFIIEVYIEEI